MKRFLALVLVALLLPLSTLASPPQRSIEEAVARMELPSLEGRLRARAAAAAIVRRTARVLGLADAEVRRAERILVTRR